MQLVFNTSLHQLLLMAQALMASWRPNQICTTTQDTVQCIMPHAGTELVRAGVRVLVMYGKSVR